MEPEDREEADKYVTIDDVKNTVNLISPTTGEVIAIKGKNVRVGTSYDALTELKHVEEQILDMSVLPDFGYAEDNYILSRGENTNKWQLLTELLDNPEKFSWLMNHIKLNAA